MLLLNKEANVVIFTGLTQHTVQGTPPAGVMGRFQVLGRDNFSGEEGIDSSCIQLSVIPNPAHHELRNVFPVKFIAFLLGNYHYDLLLYALIKQNCPLTGQICCTVNHSWDILSKRLYFTGLKPKWSEVKAVQSCWLFMTSWTIYSPWSPPGQNTGVGSLSLLQGIFPTQGLDPGLLHCRQILY